MTTAEDESHEIAQVQRELNDARDLITRMKLEIWELRDTQVEERAADRQLDYLIRENERLRYLVRRPWRVAVIGAKGVTAKVSRRMLSMRTSMDAD